MTITAKNSTTVTINGVDFLLSAITVVLIGQKWLQVIKNSDNSDIVPKSYYKNLTDGSTGLKFTSLATFTAAMSTAFGLSPAGTKQAAFVANTATAPGVAYVQAEATAALTELRAVKTALQAAGIMKAS